VCVYECMYTHINLLVSFKWPTAWPEYPLIRQGQIREQVVQGNKTSGHGVGLSTFLHPTSTVKIIM
jgi:hypothetical protein